MTERGSSSASTRQLLHFLQTNRADDFQQYDYGEKKNMKKYGQKHPPSIDLTKIEGVPIAMFVGKQDDLSTPEVGQWTLDKVSKTVVYYEEIEDHDHFTSAVGKDMSFVTDVINLLDAFNSS